MAYLARSFELGRVFKFEWTVNFKFLDEEAFVSPVLSVALLVSTVAALALFAAKWMRSDGKIRDLAADNGSVGTGAGASTDMFGNDSRGAGRQLLPEYVVKTLFVSNFIGVVFCRSLHYQVPAAIMCAVEFRPRCGAHSVVTCQRMLLSVLGFRTGSPPLPKHSRCTSRDIHRMPVIYVALLQDGHEMMCPVRSTTRWLVGWQKYPPLREHTAVM